MMVFFVFLGSKKRDVHMMCLINKINRSRYKQDRRKKDNKAKHKATELKEVKMSYKIETHDYEVRLRNAKKFLKQGNRVRGRRRGRETRETRDREREERS